MHTLFVPEIPEQDGRIEIGGDEGRHATRVKRIGVGDVVRVVDGRGSVAVADVIEAGRRLVLRVSERHHEPPVRPAVHVWSATPKGPRAADLVDGLAQVGAASWTSMATALGVVDPRESKLSRLERIVIEATKQCGRAWAMRIEGKRSFGEALAGVGVGESVVLADASGDMYERSGADTVRLLVGPEGGFTRDEIERARGGGARIARFGPHAMRIEVAAAVAAAIVLDREREGLASR